MLTATETKNLLNDLDDNLHLFTKTNPYIWEHLSVTSDMNTEVIRIAPDGSLYWKGRLVETDEEFKLAMLDLKEVLCQTMF